MITYNIENIQKINNWTDNTIHILSDFDKTITTKNSKSTWGILVQDDVFKEESQKLFNKYRPMEIDTKLDEETRSEMMRRWWEASTNLFIKSKLTEKHLKEITQAANLMEFRKGAKEFLKNMHERNIPVLLLSAGIGNFIEQFLIANDCNYENIYIISNFLKFENGIATGLTNQLIHSANKKDMVIPHNIQEKISDRPHIILLGDNISDVDMAQTNKPENILKIGFLEENEKEHLKNYKEKYDIVCTQNTSFDELRNELEILKG